MVLEADYLVVGAGATGMAFTDALIDHADVRVAMVDRRHSVGGHWLDAYPFVRLHQASSFYGVASTLLGGGRIQQDGPEAGLHERADRAGDLRLLRPGADRPDAGRAGSSSSRAASTSATAQFVSRVSGERFEVPERCRVVDARYLAPDIPADTPPPFGGRGRCARDPGQRPRRPRRSAERSTSSSGSGKTATDACIWLLERRRRPRRASAGSGRATRGCSTAPWSSRTRRSSSAWPRT